MIQAKSPTQLTFEEYLTYDDGTDYREELVDGELVQMTPASPRHSDIAEFLFIQFYLEIQRQGLDWKVKPGDVGVRTSARKSRLPDVMVMKGATWQNLLTEPSAVLQSPPLLVVEVISPDRRIIDTSDKRSEYEAVGIPEYWTVDWDTNSPNITILQLVNGRYQDRVFTLSQRIVSQIFPELSLTAQQVLLA